MDFEDLKQEMQESSEMADPGFWKYWAGVFTTFGLIWKYWRNQVKNKRRMKKSKKELQPIERLSRELNEIEKQKRKNDEIISRSEKTFFAP